MLRYNKSQYFILVAFLIASTFIQASFQQAPPTLSRVYCPAREENEDPSTVICTLEFLPVCGYSNGSSTGVTAGNACGACRGQQVDYYVPGACEGDNEQDNGEDSNVDVEINQCPTPDLSATDIVCTLQYEPVCAFYKNDTNRTNGRTIGNSCEACLQLDYDFYINGSCLADNEVYSGDGEEGLGETGEEGLITYCEIPDLSATDIACTLQYEPVCAYSFSTEDLSQGTTVGNACTACLQKGFDYYTKGACQDEGNGEGAVGESEYGAGVEVGTDPIESGEEIIINEDLYPNNTVAVRCQIPDLSATNIACTLQYEPVCGYYENDTNQTNGKTIGNACQACLQQGFDYYIDGECPEQQQESEEEVEVQNAVDQVVERCEPSNVPPSEVICTMQFDPVCAYSDNDTLATNGTTFGNACLACSRGNFDYYITGACSGNQTNEGVDEPVEEFPVEETNLIPVENQAGLEDPVNSAAVRCEASNVPPSEVVCTMDVDPVCGYKDGNNEGKTFSNSCQACGVQRYDYYTQGACEDQA